MSLYYFKENEVGNFCLITFKNLWCVTQNVTGMEKWRCIVHDFKKTSFFISHIVCPMYHTESTRYVTLKEAR